MIGIYKITNTLNNMIYIGQSIDLKTRLRKHKNSCTQFIDKEIQKYKEENFLFEIIEECGIEELNQREKYWISFYDSYAYGYNATLGGDNVFYGENNPNSKMTGKEVLEIRKRRFLCQEIKQQVYKDYCNKISFSGFTKIWCNNNWKTIGQQYYTINRKFQSDKEKGKIGSKNNQSKINDEQVMILRKEYQYKTINEISKEYSKIYNIGFSTIERILIGHTYKNLPIYKKSIGKWI